MNSNIDLLKLHHDLKKGVMRSSRKAVINHHSCQNVQDFNKQTSELGGLKMSKYHR